MELEYVKSYLRVDFDDDDEYINLLITAAKDYIINAVGYWDENKALMKLLALTLISQMYEKRQYSIDTQEAPTYAIKSIVLQLQLSQEEA